jgi:hypothetical protein
MGSCFHIGSEGSITPVALRSGVVRKAARPPSQMYGRSVTFGLPTSALQRLARATPRPWGAIWSRSSIFCPLLEVSQPPSTKSLRRDTDASRPPLDFTLEESFNALATVLTGEARDQIYARQAAPWPGGWRRAREWRCRCPTLDTGGPVGAHILDTLDPGARDCQRRGEGIGNDRDAGARNVTEVTKTGPAEGYS